MNEQKGSYRIIISGGGTGGHIFPAIAIARALQQRESDMQILFVGAKGKMEMEKIPQAGYAIRALDIRGMDRGQWWKNITLPYFVLKSLLQARNILHEFKPHAVVGVGDMPVSRYCLLPSRKESIHLSRNRIPMLERPTSGWGKRLRGFL